MFVFTQAVQISWGKTARGGRLSDLRATVPSVFKLSSEKQRCCNGIYSEEQRWSESNEFQQPLEVKSHCEVADFYNFRCATINCSNKEVSVEWIWDWWKTGAPRRFPARRKTLVSLDSWLQFRWNGRFSDHDSGCWSYEEVILNVAHTAQKPLPDFFTGSNPVRCCDYRAQLW